MKRLASALLLGQLAACQTVPVPNGPREVSTTSGSLAGETIEGLSVFKGIPYARPPVGELRWAPLQPTSWTGARTATTFGTPCLHAGAMRPAETRHDQQGRR